MSGFSKPRRADTSGNRNMKLFYWAVAVAIVVTILAVLFVPGVDDFVEQVFQQYLGRAAR